MGRSRNFVRKKRVGTRAWSRKSKLHADRKVGSRGGKEKKTRKAFLAVDASIMAK